MQVHWRRIHAARNTYAILAAASEQAGYPMDLVDRPVPDVTCYSLNSLSAPALKEEIRTAPCITIAGGPYATACYQEVAAWADYVVVGEGEHTLPALLATIEEGDGRVPPGVATGEGYTPATSSVVLDAYPPFSQVKGYIEISRGCPHRCGYCQTPQIFGHCMRHRSIDVIARAAERCRDVRCVTPNALAYGSDGIHPRLDKVEHLLRRLSGAIYIGTFPSEVRPEFITPEALDLICTYCSNTRLHFGAQSGSDRVLTALGRGHTVAAVEEAVELCREAGITPVVDMIVGLPCDDDESERATGKLIRWVADRGIVHAHQFMPLPATRLANSAPRPLLPETEHILGHLSSTGKLTGSWQIRH
ncbi:TIGR04013 family B12-binding domain/radical SAM domain-containing protein [Methanosphaerula subterraneus]|uniref:TIGR04013 family B12-binding domain/radical SAM domain-containing protein n=1 Tax=Methanosphaerula subterraneus TaxID=3350244 RepID=UPI003F85EDFE